MSNDKKLLGDLQRADLSFCDGADSFLQSGFWGSFKSRFGWEALAFKTFWNTCSDNHESADLESTDLESAKSLLVLRRRLAPCVSLVYVPWGPELPDGIFRQGILRQGILRQGITRQCAIKELAINLIKILPKETVFIRFEPPWLIESEDRSLLTMPPLVRSRVDIQPPDSVIIDLTQSIESIKEQMKPKWRYNANLALKKGVKITESGVEKIHVFYELLSETAQRDGISIHSLEYYRTLFECGKGPDIRLYLAEHDGETIAGIVTLFRKSEAVYLYGASSNKKRNLMAPYALQLKGMEDAKSYGCTGYDLFGIPPNADPEHPMAGLYRFKTGFGGKVIHRSGSWDFPCRKISYRIFCFAENFRKAQAIKKKQRKQLAISKN